MKTESSQRRQVLPQNKKKYFKKKGVGHQCAVRKVKQDEDSLWAMEMIIDLTTAVWGTNIPKESWEQKK